VVPAICLYRVRCLRRLLPRSSPTGTDARLRPRGIRQIPRGLFCVRVTDRRDESAARIPILIIYVVPTIRCVTAGALTGSVRVHPATSRSTRFGGARCCSASCARCSPSATGTPRRPAAGATGATTSRSSATTAAALCQRGRTDGDCCKQRKSEYFSYRHAGLHVGVCSWKPPTRGLFRFGQTAARSVRYPTKAAISGGGKSSVPARDSTLGLGSLNKRHGDRAYA
jgi:hypothetical protein